MGELHAASAASGSDDTMVIQHKPPQPLAVRNMAMAPCYPIRWRMDCDRGDSLRGYVQPVSQAFCGLACRAVQAQRGL